MKLRPTSTASIPPRVLIVGGGIGGLCLAVGLRSRGADVTVVERAPDWSPVGAGITLQPNATAVLGALGVSVPAEDQAALTGGAVVDGAGHPLVSGDLEPARAGLPPAWTLHRADLHRALLAAAEGVTLRLGVGIEALEDGAESVRVRLSDGETADWAHVIGADGIHSTVRRLLLGEAACRLRYSGQTCWRFAIASDLPRTSAIEVWVPGRRAGIVPLSRGRFYVYLVQGAPEGTPGPGTATPGVMKERFGGVLPDLDRLIDELGPDDFVHHGDLHDQPQLAWGRGRVLLLGDAAHAMTPNMGQGAAMAVEDAGVLTRLLTSGQSPAEILEAYAAAREDRVRRVHTTSWRIGQLAHWEHPIARAIRDFLLRRVPDSVTLRQLRDTWDPGLAIAEALEAG